MTCDDDLGRSITVVEPLELRTPHILEMSYFDLIQSESALPDLPQRPVDIPDQDITVARKELYELATSFGVETHIGLLDRKSNDSNGQLPKPKTKKKRARTLASNPAATASAATSSAAAEAACVSATTDASVDALDKHHLKRADIAPPGVNFLHSIIRYWWLAGGKSQCDKSIAGTCVM